MARPRLGRLGLSGHFGASLGVDLSLGEFQDLARKAGRGAGYAWGEADEVGQAARWLARQGFPAGSALAVLLPQVGRRFDSKRCPIRLGCRFADHALAVSNSLRLVDVAAPVFILPFLSWSLEGDPDACIEMRHVGGDAKTQVTASAISRHEGRWPDLATVAFDRLANPARPVQHAAFARVALAASVHEVLEGYAARTLAPETEERRRSGAGGREE